MPQAKSKQRNGAGCHTGTCNEVRSRKKSKSSATTTTAMCNMDGAGAGVGARSSSAGSSCSPTRTAIASGSNVHKTAIRQVRRSGSGAAADTDNGGSTGSPPPPMVPPAEAGIGIGIGIGCNMIRNDSLDSVNLAHDDMSMLCMHSAVNESPAASSSRGGSGSECAPLVQQQQQQQQETSGPGVSPTCSASLSTTSSCLLSLGGCGSGSGSGSGETSTGGDNVNTTAAAAAFCDDPQQQQRCDACFQDGSLSSGDHDSLLLLDAKLGIRSMASGGGASDDCATATTDWNGFWIPVVANDDQNHNVMMHLMSSDVAAAGTSASATGPGASFSAVDGHGSSHVSVVAYGAPGMLRTTSRHALHADYHHQQQQQQQSSDGDRSGFLEPMFSTPGGVYHTGTSPGGSRSPTSPMSTLGLPSSALAAADHVQFKQHSAAQMPAPQVDFCHSLLNVEDEQQQQPNSSSSSRIIMSGMHIMSDAMSMSNLDSMNCCRTAGGAGSGAGGGGGGGGGMHMSNMWMHMDQWMEGHSTLAAGHLHDHHCGVGSRAPTSEVEWTCNYPGAGYLPPAAADTAYNAMMQHVSPPPSLGSPNMSTLLRLHQQQQQQQQQQEQHTDFCFMDNSPTTISMASSPHMGPSLGLSTSAALDYSNPFDHQLQDGGGGHAIFTHCDTSGGCIPTTVNIGATRRHSPAVKRSLSFMQSMDEDDTHARADHPCSPAHAHAARSSAAVKASRGDGAMATTTTSAAPLPVGLKLASAPSTSATCTTTTAFRPGIDDAAAQLSALLYTKSRTDIGNNAISQYHKLAFQNSFYSNTKLDNPSSTASSSGVGLASKSAARRRHGTATDPQSIAARTRRERFSDRIRILQSLVPNGERLDTVSMLGQTLEYVRFLQQQVWQLYNGTSPAPISAPPATTSAAPNLTAQVASAESLAASFLSTMAQRQAAAATASPQLLSSSNSNSNSSSKLAAAAGLGLVDKWKKLATSPHVPAECTPVA